MRIERKFINGQLHTHIFHEEIMLLITQILSLLVSNQNPGYPTRNNWHKNSRNMDV